MKYVDVIPIGFEEDLAEGYFSPSEIVGNRVLWIGRDEPNRRPEMPLNIREEIPIPKQ